MPIIFKSEAQASVEMIEGNARQLLEILGRDPEDVRGVFDIDQIAGAIALLNSLVTSRADQRRRLALAEVDEKAGEVFEVDISLRAIPLLALFEQAERNSKPVTWGI